MGHTSASDGEVRLDDLELMDGVCPPQLTCTFDDTNKNCQWDVYFGDGGTLPWSIGSGSENVSSAPMYVLLLFHNNGYLILIIYLVTKVILEVYVYDIKDNLYPLLPFFFFINMFISQILTCFP